MWTALAILATVVLAVVALYALAIWASKEPENPHDWN